MPSTAPKLTPVLVTNAVPCGAARILMLYLDSSNAVKSAPDRTVKATFYNLGRDPNKAVVTADGAFVWTIENERGMYVFNVNLPEAGTWGAEFTTEAPGSPAETVRLSFPVRADIPTIGIGQKAPASKTPTAADVGGDLTKISTDKSPGPGLLQDLGRGCARRAQAVHARLRDAEVLHERAMRADARPLQADRRGPSRDHVHQRRAVPAQGRGRFAAAGARREQRAPGDRHHRTSGACSRSRGSSPSIETGSCAARTR